MELVALGDVLPSTEVKSSQPSGLADVGETSLDRLTASAEQPLAERTLESAAVLVESSLETARLFGADLVGQALPSASSPRSAFRDAGHVASPIKVSQRLDAVVAAVGDDLLDGKIRVGSFNSRLRMLQGLGQRSSCHQNLPGGSRPRRSPHSPDPPHVPPCAPDASSHPSSS